MDAPHVTLDMSASEWEAVIEAARAGIESFEAPDPAWSDAVNKLQAVYDRERGFDDWGGVTT